MNTMQQIAICAAGALTLALLVVFIFVRVTRRKSFRSAPDARSRIGINRFVLSADSESPDGTHLRRRVRVDGRVVWSDSDVAKERRKHLIAEINAGRSSEKVIEQMRAFSPELMRAFADMTVVRNFEKEQAEQRARDIARTALDPLSAQKRAQRIEAAKQEIRDKGQDAPGARSTGPRVVQGNLKSAPVSRHPESATVPQDDWITNPANPLYFASPLHHTPSSSLDSGSSSCDSSSSSSSSDSGSLSCDSSSSSSSSDF